MIKSLRKVKLCEMVHTETSPCEFEQPIRGLMSDSIEMLEIVFIAMCPFVTWCNFPGFLLLAAQSLINSSFLGVVLPSPVARLLRTHTQTCKMCLP